MARDEHPISPLADMSDRKIITSRPRQQKLVTISLVLISILLAGWFLGPSGAVRGTEFSPDLFSHRSFRYYQWCGIPISFKSTHEWRTDIDDYLHERGYVPTYTGDDPRWDFIKGFAPGVRGWSGEAKSMCQGLGCFSGDDRWIEWSREHPEFADVVWPQVVKWAREERYYVVNCLFSFTDLKDATTVEEIQQNLSEAERVAQM